MYQKRVPNNLLVVHGCAPGTKADVVTQLLMENINGLSTSIDNNTTLEKSKLIIEEFEADIVAITEHRIKFMNKSNFNGFNQMF